MPVACRLRVFLIRHARRHHEKREQRKKITIKNNWNSHSRTVGTQKWTTRADYWQPTEAMCMASRHRPVFMDVATYRACVFYWSHAEQPQKKRNSPKNRHRGALQNMFVVRVHSVLDAAPCFWDACRGHVCDLTPLAGVCGCIAGILSLSGTWF